MRTNKNYSPFLPAGSGGCIRCCVLTHAAALLLLPPQLQHPAAQHPAAARPFTARWTDQGRAAPSISAYSPIRTHLATLTRTASIRATMSTSATAWPRTSASRSTTSPQRPPTALVPADRQGGRHRSCQLHRDPGRAEEVDFRAALHERCAGCHLARQQCDHQPGQLERRRSDARHFRHHRRDLSGPRTTPDIPCRSTIPTPTPRTRWKTATPQPGPTITPKSLHLQSRTPVTRWAFPLWAARIPLPPL